LIQLLPSPTTCKEGADMHRFIFIIGLFLASTLFADNEPTQFSGTNFKDFNILYTKNLRGDIRIIGNSIIGQWQRFWFRYINNTICPGNNTNNALVASRWWDIDNDSSTFNSSSANLAIPAGSTIKKAYLYWQGRAASNWYNSAKSIKFRPPGSSSYTTLTAPDDNVYWATFGTYFPYQASVEVTDLMNGSGTYTIADLVTYAGNDVSNRRFPDPLGAYGAWSLVVVYENDDEILQNITIYDGYQAISDNNVQDFTLSGFLTPKNGNVNSKFLIFTGEGDVDLSGDYVNMNGTRLTRFNDNSTDPNNYNAFNASITNNGAYVTSRNPSCQNNFGIDIHTYSVGTDGLGIIGNDQSSATLTIGTNGDMYFLSVFAFATQLYEPRVCYFIDTIRDKDSNETVFEDKGFKPGVGIEPNKDYAFDIWISNMKKSTDEGTIETAELVQVYMNMTNVDYDESSTLMKNLGDSSFATRNDLFDFTPGSDHNGTSTYRVGLGANSAEGGTIAPAANFNDDSKKAFIKFDGQFIIDDENATSLNLVEFFDFSAAFKVYDIVIGPENAIKISQCEDLNTSADIIRPLRGAFDVVNSHFSGSSLGSESDNALYTQVAGQSFDVKVVALEAIDPEAEYPIPLRSHTGDVNVSIINTPAYHNDPIEDQKACDSATPLISKIVSFNDQDNILESFTINNAHRNLSFKVSYEQNGKTINVCARDNFAVRPASYEFDFNPTPLIGGKRHRITTKALQYNSSSTTNLYNGNAEQNLTLIIKPPCAIGADSNNTNITFDGGDNETDVKTGNIGDYNLSVVDKTWTAVDQGHSHGDDCNPNDSNNTHDAYGKVGCNVAKFQTITFSPKDFNIALSVKNFDGNFTYISNDKAMSATIDYSVTARLEDNNTATAYDRNCYAKDINSTIEMLTTKPHGWGGTNNSTAINRIRYFDDGNTTTFRHATDGEVILSSTDGNFTEGTANLRALFNFDRNISTPDMPFIISKNDFNITVVDTNDTKGADFDRTIDKNTTFYYGRVFAPDYRGPSPLTARIYYEVFCNDCNQSDFNIIGDLSAQGARWYINKHHNDIAQGRVRTEGATLGFTSVGDTDTGKPETDHIANGEETLLLTKANDTTDRIKMLPDPWLIYNRYNENATTNDFIIEFLERSNWGGRGHVDRQGAEIIGKHVDDNTTSERTSRRISW